MRAPCEGAGCCIGSIVCPCVASFVLRKQQLRGDLSQYTCCNGYLPCSGRCGESSCPSVCLALESTCCFTLSVASTRFAIQDEMMIANTPCDNCIIGTMVVLNQLACICSICAIFFEELENLADCLVCASDICFCTVCACMQVRLLHTSSCFVCFEKDRNHKGLCTYHEN